MATIDSDPSADASRFRAPLAVLTLLTLAAGFADGYALTRFDVFVANQSGNVVHVGMGAVGEYAAWDLALLAMLGFAVGGVVSSLLVRAADRTRLPLVHLRLVTVGVFVLLWWVAVVLVTDGQDAARLAALAGSAAMGVMATVLTHIAGVRAQTTFQSSTVLRSAQGLLNWAARRGPEHRTGRTLALIGALTLGCYALGGAVGAVSAGRTPSALLVLLVPIVGVLLLVHRGQ